MRKIPLLIFVIGVILIGIINIDFVSASYYNDGFNHRYQGPEGKSSVSYYQDYNDGSGYYDYHGNYRYNIQEHANTPIFKGSYGNYRYQMYDNGDYRPSLFFVNYPEYGYAPYFGGGYGNYYGYYPYYNNYGYSYNNYGLNYYPSYSYSYSGCYYGC